MHPEWKVLEVYLFNCSFRAIQHRIVPGNLYGFEGAEGDARMNKGLHMAMAIVMVCLIATNKALTKASFHRFSPSVDGCGEGGNPYEGFCEPVYSGVVIER
jgi:hypothetical protein